MPLYQINRIDDDGDNTKFDFSMVLGEGKASEMVVIDFPIFATSESKAKVQEMIEQLSEICALFPEECGDIPLWIEGLEETLEDDDHWEAVAAAEAQRAAEQERRARMASVSYGVWCETSLDLVGRTVADLKDEYLKKWGADRFKVVYFINGAKAPSINYALQPGDELQIMRVQGDRGGQ